MRPWASRIRRILALLFLFILCGAFVSFAAEEVEPEKPAESETPKDQAPESDEAAKMRSMVERISGDVAAIRGLPFKESLKAENQTLDDFHKFLDVEFARQMPEKKAKNYGKVVKALGLYRGPEIEDFVALAKDVMSSQAAAYYNPTTSTFYILASGMSPDMLGVIFAHEIYHGLQDQYWDLDNYLLNPSGGALNEDETLARQCVVEGEASYIMTIWMMRHFMKTEPQPDALEMTIKMQSNVGVDQMRQMAKGGALAGEGMEDIAKSVEAMDELPRFVIETLIGAYLKGMWFTFEVQKEGWDKSAMLYSTLPPVSTEQILHPEKWFDGEKPNVIEWPELETNPLLKDWELLESNTLGEMQWRVIFEEWEMANRAKGVAEGWDGDSYAVFKKKEGDGLLLLWRTCWDTEGDALQFEDAYRDLLKAKYPEGAKAAQVVVEGNDVLILEGAAEKDSDALMKIIHDAKKTRMP